MLQTLIFIAFGLLAVYMLLNPLTKKKKSQPPVIETPIQETPIPTEVIGYETPVLPDPEPTPTLTAEMPIKPTPIDCQLAIFRPAPETFSYYDCCGEIHVGEGYQPWEKRSPVSIDVMRDFTGMDLIGQDSQVDC